MAKMLDINCTLILRTARKAHVCKGCRAEIPCRAEYVEYVGEVPAYSTGVRYCMACYEREWGNAAVASPSCRDGAET